VPFVFVLDPKGLGLLMKIPPGGHWTDIVLISVIAAIGLGALACAAQGWALRRTTPLERGVLVLAGLFLVFPSLLEALAEAIIGRDISYTPAVGVVLFAIVLLKQYLQPAAPPVVAPR
jgi:TRAP-type uncharacterized transport system fused permease subunit